MSVEPGNMVLAESHALAIRRLLAADTWPSAKAAAEDMGVGRDALLGAVAGLRVRRATVRLLVAWLDSNSGMVMDATLAAIPVKTKGTT